MQKVKIYSKKTLSMFLSVLMAVSCMFIISPKAEAANTAYKYKVYIRIDDTGSAKNSYVDVYFKDSSGLGGDSSTRITSSSSMWGSDGGGEYSYEGSSDSYKIPYQIHTHVESNSTGASIKWYAYLYIWDYVTSTYVLVGGGDTHWSLSNATAFTTTKKDGYDAMSGDKYPYVTSATISDTSDISISDSTLTASRTYSASNVVDQYGVSWYTTTPSSWATSTNSTISGSTVTYKDAAADYSNTITSTWASANTAHNPSSVSATNKVKVTRSATFDNLFDFSAWRRAGITAGNACTVSNITSTGFTVTSTAGTDGYCAFSSAAKTPVTAGKTYILTADISGNTSGYEMFIQYHYDSGASSTYSNSHTSTLEFTVPSGCSNISIRFDANASGNSINVSNIRIVEKGTALAETTVATPGMAVAYNKYFKNYTAPIPTKTAYDFAGWYDASGVLNYNSSGAWAMPNNTDKAISSMSGYCYPLTSKWTPTNYTITFKDGDTIVDTSDYNIESTSVTIPTVSKTGYTFTGWTVSSAAGNWSSGDAVVSSLSSKYGNITVTANWKANDYKLSFNANDDSLIGFATGDSLADRTVTYDSSIGTLPVLSLTGYTCNGWYTAATGGTKISDNATYQIAGNSTYYAHWNVNDYTLTLDADGGTYADDAQTSFTYNIETTGITLPKPEKIGWTFSHYEVVAEETGNNWYGTDETYGTAVSLDKKWGNVTFKAVYNPNKYNLTFDMAASSLIGGGNAVLSGVEGMNDITFNTVIGGTFPTASLNAYDFKGWVDINGDAVTNESTYKYSGNTTFFGVWSPVQYSVSVIIDEMDPATPDDDVYSDDILVYDIEDTSITLPAHDKEGYTLTEYVVSETDGNWGGMVFASGENAIDALYGNATLKAVYSANTYTLSFDKNDSDRIGDSVVQGSVALADREVVYDGVIGTLPTLSLSGYVFGGWVDENGNSVDADTIYKVIGDSTLKAVWIPNEYTLTFDAADGNVEPATIIYTIETDIVLPVPTKDGHDFLGWKTPRYFTGLNNWTANKTYEDSIQGSGHYGDVTFTAQWSTISYNVTFVIDGVENTNPYEYGTVLTPENPVKASTSTTHYTFEGWALTENGAVLASLPDVTADATYYAVFSESPVEYTVTWRDDDGTELHTMSVANGADVPVNAYSVPERTGYTCEWVCTDSVMPANNIDITAKYTPIPYTVTWVTASGVFDTTWDYDSYPDHMRDGDNVNTDKPADAQYTYTFDGWSLTDGGNELDAIPSVTGNATYYAVYSSTVNEYSVKWHIEESTVSKDYKYGDTPSYAGTPTKDMTLTTVYTFAGWSLTAGGEILEAIPAVTGTADYYAVFAESARKFVVTWVDENNEVIDTREVANGTAVPTDVPAPEKRGYTVTWEATGLMPTEPVTVHAVYTPNNYPVHWVVEGVTVKTDNVAFDSLPEYTGATPEKAATEEYTYTFTGWAPEIVEVSEFETTYTAVFEPVPVVYTITWINGETNETVKVSSVPFGTLIDDKIIPEVPAHSLGYSGAWENVPETMPAENITIKSEYVTGSAVTWVIDDNTYHDAFEQGTQISYSRTEPSREATKEYSYKFIGWSDTQDGEVLESLPISTMDPMTFYAIFEPVPNPYTLTWIGNNFKKELTYLYGETITVIDVPDKEGHTGVWGTVPATMPAENVTIEAVYTPNSYKVTWVTGSGEYSENYVYGTIPAPEAAGVNTDKAADVQYTYTFNGWDKDITAVPANDNTVYTAVYINTVNKYDITWVLDPYDATVENDVTSVEYGETPAHEDPVKAPDAQYSYTFTGWTPKLEAVTGTATYAATFSETPIPYDVIWMADGKEVYRETVGFGEALPTKEVPAKTGHTGVWDSSYEAMPAGNVTITAVYTPIDYTITWITGSGTYTGTWAYGTTPAYSADGVNIAKPQDAQYTYTFTQWLNQTAGTVGITSVTGDTTYVAQYANTTRKYDITWIVEGVSRIDSVEYGKVPEFGSTPKKTSTAQYNFVFDKWDSAVEAVTGPATYTATFRSELRSYDVKWIVDGETVKTDTLFYGETPSNNEIPAKEMTETTVYTFEGWALTENGAVLSSPLSTVKGAVSYYAVFAEKTREFTVTYVVSGNIYQTISLPYGSEIPKPDIPEITGYSAIWQTNHLTMPTENITVTAVYSPKIYKVTWVADGVTVYTADVAFGSVIPVKAVPELVGHSGVWGDKPVTMPAEDVTITAVYTVESYIVIWKIVGNSGSDTATYGVDYTMVFEEHIPANVRITVGGKLISTDSYAYDAETGTLVIAGVAIVGTVSITEKAAAGYQNVIISALNATFSNEDDIVKEGETYHTQIFPAEGYLLPEEVSVCIDGIELYEGYTYDANTGKLTINAEKMVGELSISFDCPSDPDYDPEHPSVNCTCNCHSSSAFVRFFWSIINFLRRIFGMTKYQYCQCGTAHW